MDIRTKRYAILAVLVVVVILVIGGIILGVMSFLDKESSTDTKSITKKKIAEQTTRPPPPAQPVPSLSPPVEVALRTEDGVKIAGTYYPASGEGVVLLHMLGSDKEAWTPFAQKLQKADYAVLAIDLRGHGDSDLDWQDFSYPSGKTRKAQNDFLGMLYDVKAAKKYLNEEGKFATIVMGASIGANIAALYAETDPRVKQLVLFSPGLNYRGVSLPAGPLFDGRVLLVGATEDKAVMEALKAYPPRVRGEYKTIVYSGNAHGTELLDTQLDLTGRVMEWMKK